MSYSGFIADAKHMLRKELADALPLHDQDALIDRLVVAIDNLIKIRAAEVSAQSFRPLT